VKKLISLLTFIFFLPLQASDVFETADMNVALKKIDEAMVAQRNQTPNERAEFYYETTIDRNSCAHCPEYLKLVKEVNSIVEKIPPSNDIATTNQQVIQIDRLKFLYYESVSAMNGNETCSILDAMDPTLVNGVDRDKLTLLAEEFISLPNVTSLQYYPKPPEKEIRYIYRGEGLQSHILIEVIVHADKTATMRYHHYFPYDLPDIGGVVTEKPRKLNEIETSLSFSDNFEVDTKTTLNLSDQSTRATLRREDSEWIQLEGRHKKDSEASLKAVLPVEIIVPSESGVRVTGGLSQEHLENLNTDNREKIEGAKINIGNDKNKNLISAQMEKREGKTEVVVGSRYQTSFDNSLKVEGEIEERNVETDYSKSNQQKIQVTLSDGKGREYIRARVDNVNETETIHLGTKHQWDLDSEKGLRVRAEASQQTIDDNTDKKKKNEMVMSLTDHNHEYVTARVVQGDELDRLIALSSRYTVGDNTTVNATVNRYDSGKESISFGHQMRSGSNSYQTNIGHDSEKGQFINFKAEKKISSTASMVVSVQTDSNHSTTFMYQFESKF